MPVDEVQAGDDVAADRAQAAVRVRDANPEEDVEHPRQDRVADVAVRPGHRAPRNRSLEAVTDHHVRAAPQPLDEGPEDLDRIRPVGIRHDDVLAPRGCESCEVGAAVAAARLVDDGAPAARRELSRSVLGRVVDDDDLAPAPASAIAAYAASTTGDPRPLRSEARNHDGDLDLVAELPTLASATSAEYSPHASWAPLASPHVR